MGCHLARNAAFPPEVVKETNQQFCDCKNERSGVRKKGRMFLFFSPFVFPPELFFSSGLPHIFFSSFAVVTPINGLYNGVIIAPINGVITLDSILITGRGPLVFVCFSGFVCFSMEAIDFKARFRFRNAAMAVGWVVWGWGKQGEREAMAIWCHLHQHLISSYNNITL